MEPSDVAVCCDGRFDSICPSSGAYLLLCKWQKLSFTITDPPRFFTVGVIPVLQLFCQIFGSHRPFYLTPKGLYSALLSSVCALANGNFLTMFCFINGGFFCDNLLLSLILRLMFLSLSLHCLHLLFCCVLSILALIWFYIWWVFLPVHYFKLIQVRRPFCVCVPFIIFR